jgi:hypothetical protein
MAGLAQGDGGGSIKQEIHRENMTIPKKILFFFRERFVLLEFHAALVDDGSDSACPPTPPLRLV